MTGGARLRRARALRTPRRRWPTAAPSSRAAWAPTPGPADGDRVVRGAALRRRTASRSAGEAAPRPGAARRSHRDRCLATAACSSPAAAATSPPATAAPARPLASTELYDPGADLFTPGPPLLHARFGHDAVLRGDGTVLLVGGRGDGGGAVAAEIVDPDELRGFDAGVASGRAAGLPTGSALVVGGTTTRRRDRVAVAVAGRGAAAARRRCAQPRLGPTLTPLDDGAVLVAGGGDARAGAVRRARHRHRARRRASARAIRPPRRSATARCSCPAAATAARRRRRDSGRLLPLAAVAVGQPAAADARRRAAIPTCRAAPIAPSAGGGQLVVTAAGADRRRPPAELALVAGMQVADFTFDLLAGRRGAAGAAVLVGWQSDAAYDFVVLEPGRAVELWSVASPRTGQIARRAGARLPRQRRCPTAISPTAISPPLEVSWRAGTLAVSRRRRAAVALLARRRCRAARVGVGALPRHRRLRQPRARPLTSIKCAQPVRALAPIVGRDAALVRPRARARLRLRGRRRDHRPGLPAARRRRRARQPPPHRRSTSACTSSTSARTTSSAARCRRTRST